MNYSLLHQIIEDLETFEQQMGQRPIKDFALWMYEKYVDPDSNISIEPNPDFDNDLNAEMGYGVSVLYQHSRHYIRKALKGSKLNGVQDFGFLATLMEIGDMTKSQLIEHNFLDYSPGMEVIRRLIKRGLAEDYPAPEDARSRMVRATEAGKQEFGMVIGKVQQAGHIIGGNLETGEKLRAVAGIRKLLHFHSRIWKEDHEKSLDEIMEKYPEVKP